MKRPSTDLWYTELMYYFFSMITAEAIKKDEVTVEQKITINASGDSGFEAASSSSKGFLGYTCWLQLIISLFKVTLLKLIYRVLLEIRNLGKRKDLSEPGISLVYKAQLTEDALLITVSHNTEFWFRKYSLNFSK